MYKNAKYFIIWIEGFDYKGGEKVKSFDTKHGEYRISYTLDMTKSLRVKREDIPKALNVLKQCNVANWVIESQNTFISTSYAPKGTIWKP